LVFARAQDGLKNVCLANLARVRVHHRHAFACVIGKETFGSTLGCSSDRFRVESVTGLGRNTQAVTEDLNLFQYRRLCLIARNKAAVVSYFSLVGRKEALYDGVIPTVAAPDHTHTEAIAGQGLLVILTVINAATIAAVQDLERTALHSYRKRDECPQN
jgi:hypothetical protein